MANKFTVKALAALNKVVNMLRDPDKLVSAAASATFPPCDMPSASWSVRNRWIAVMQAGEVDCRTYAAWERVGRKVKRGAKAVFILKPIMCTVRDSNGKPIKDKQGKTEMRCTGFKGHAVHPADNTEGDPLEYENPEIINTMPLKTVADAWGINVAGRPFVGGYLGYFSNSQDAIRVCTDDEKVFLHELTHAAHNRLLKGKGSALKGGQHASQEIVAELGAAVLARLYGQSLDVRKDSYEYIKRYAASENKDVLDACLGVLTETAKVISLIMDTAAEQGELAQTA